jgi:N-acetylglucosaminyl-diphospho-decaprenol L-rhamnosyltransferase
MTDKVDVSVVIVSWNVKDILLECLGSLKTGAAGLSLQVIVVDNASGDGSAAAVRAAYPDVLVIESDVNLGFAAANNRGFSVALGDFTFILNPDTVVDAACIATLVAALKGDSGLGMVGPRLCSPDGSVQAACARRLPSLADVLLDELLGLWKPDEWRFVVGRSPTDLEKTQDVEAISGAAMLMRTADVRSLGGFGESFHHCGEDLDLCVRVRRRSGRIRYLHDAKVLHLGGQSSKQAAEWVTINALLSYEEYFRRCEGRVEAAIFRAMVWLIWAPLHLAKGIVHRLTGREDWKRFAQRRRAVRDVLLGRKATWNSSRKESSAKEGLPENSE